MTLSLRTNRLLLQEMNEHDAANMFALNNNPNVLQYTGDAPFKDIQEAKRFIAAYDQYKKYRIGRLSVYLIENNKYLGWCGLKYHPKEDTVDLGFRFLEEEWNNGYAKESGLACLEYGFLKKEYPTIIARADKRNFVSIRVINKLGFRYLKEELEEGRVWQIFSLKKEDFVNQYSLQ